MAEPVVYPIHGRPFMAPVAVGSGGTLLPGVDYARPVLIALPQGVELRRFGFERDAVRVVQQIAPPVATLFVPAMGHEVETLKLLFSAMTETGLAIVTEGGEAVPGMHPARRHSMELRPTTAGQRPWYFPALSQHTDLIAHVNMHPTLKALAETSLVLACCRLENFDAPAVGWGDAADLNELYELVAPVAPNDLEIEEVP